MMPAVSLREVLPQKDDEAISAMTYELSPITIPAGDCGVGSYCAVASFNDSHPTDAVAIAIWT